MLHVAQEMDADYIVFGNFTSDGKTLTINARILRVESCLACCRSSRKAGRLNHAD